MQQLKKEEIYDLLCLIKEQKDSKALEKLVLANIKLVDHFAYLHLSSGLNFEELQSAGIEGLIRAIKKFDYTQNILAFSTYISSSINNQMKYDINKNYKYKSIISLCEKAYEDGDLTIEDIIGSTTFLSPEEKAINKVRTQKIQELFSKLTIKQRNIILLRYGFDNGIPKTQLEVSKILGYSRAYIQQEEQKSLIKIRKMKNINLYKELI